MTSQISSLRWILAAAVFLAAPVELSAQPSGALLPQGERFGVPVEELLRQISWKTNVHAVAWSPDGRRLATGGADGTVHLWSTASGEEIARFRYEEGYRDFDEVRSVAFHPSGRRLAAAFDDGLVCIWSLEAPRAPIARLSGWTIAWDKAGSFLAVGQRSGEIHVWADSYFSHPDTENEFPRSLPGHKEEVSALDWNRDGRLASSSWDGTIRIWDNDGGAVGRPPLEGHEINVQAVAWNPEGTLLASGSSDKTVRIWDAENRAEIHRFELQEPVLAVAWSRNGRTIISGTADGTILFLDVDVEGIGESGEVRRLEEHTAAVLALAVQPDGQMFASGSADGTARIWSFDALDEVLRLEGHASRVSTLAFSHDGSHLVEGSRGLLRIWKIGENAEPQPRLLPLVGNALPTALTAGPDGMVAAGFADGTVGIWGNDGLISPPTEYHSTPVLALSFSANGHRLASVAQEGPFSVLDQETRTRYPGRPSDDGTVLTALVLNSPGTTLAAGNQSGRVRLWDLSDLEAPTEIANRDLPSGWISSLAFPAANEVWAFLRDRTMYRWEVSTGRLRRMDSWTHPLSVSLLSPDGRLFAAVRRNERIARLWTREGASSFQLTELLVGGAYQGKTWIRCQTPGPCWRYDDGTLLVQEEVGGALSAFPPYPISDSPKLELLELPGKTVDMEIGTSKVIDFQLRNTGSTTAFWIRVRRSVEASTKDPLVFHPPQVVLSLGPGEVVHLSGEISAGFPEQESEKKYSLHLEIATAAGIVRVPQSITFTINAPALHWEVLRLSGARSLKITLANNGSGPLPRSWSTVKFPGEESQPKPFTLESLSPGERKSFYLEIPENIDLDAGLSVQGVTRTVEHPVYTWTSGKVRIEASLWNSQRPLILLIFALPPLVLIALFALNRKRLEERKDLSRFDLRELSDLLQSSWDLEEVYLIAEGSLVKMFPDMDGALLLLGEENELTIVHEWGQKKQEKKEFTRRDCYALRKGDTYIVSSNTTLVCPHAQSAKGTTLLCVPLKAQGTTYAVLHLATQPSNRHISLGERKLIDEIAQEIARALAKQKEFERTYRDELTTLLDLRRWGKQLRRRMELLVAEERPFGTIMADIDHFGRVNKDHGHDVGNRILHDVGRLLRSFSRENEDIVCRYGGEEFLIVMPGASLSITRQRAEQLRQAVKKLTLDRKEGSSLEPTRMSFGVAAYPDHGDSWEKVWKAADQALKQAKTAGRDRVHIAEKILCDEQPTETLITSNHRQDVSGVVNWPGMNPTLLTDHTPLIIADRYRVVREIARGGMGIILLADDLTLNRRVALKALLADVGTETRARFEKEAKLLATLKHPHVVTVHDFIWHEEKPYIVMEYVEGESLASLMTRDLSYCRNNLRRIFLQVGSALSAMHEKSIVHRDIKPDNILITKEQKAIIVDFGIAKDINGATEAPGIKGTILYMAPERYRGEGDWSDQRSDIYSLGIIFYQIATGRRPFDIRVSPQPPTPPRELNPHVTEPFEELILSCIEYEKEKRPHRVADVTSELSQLSHLFEGY